MCGRYVFNNGDSEQLDQLIDTARKRLPKETFEKISLFEVYPGCVSFAGIFDHSSKQTVTRLMKWGYASWQKKLIINARSETCFTSAFFADSVPCALPATSYFEWSKDRQRYAFTVDDEVFYLAGLCRKENNETHFVILTEAANEDCAAIHHRQPVIFTYEKAKAWCASDTPSLLLKDSVQNRYFTKA
jgi:putative SOS response-associated peptidase YedK